MSRTAVLSAVIVFFAVTPAAAAPRPGSLDRSFGDDGTVSTVIPGVSQMPGMGVQPDGAIVVGGYFNDAPGDAHAAVVARFTPAGALDPGFGAGGIARIPLPESAALTALGLGPNGEIVLAGQSFDTAGPMLVRLTAEGTPDPSFDGDGIAVTSAWHDGNLEDLVVHPDGTITAVGSTGAEPSGYAIRVLSDGRLDPAFDPDGVIAPLSISSSASVFDEIELDSNGAAVAAADHQVVYDEPAHQLVARFPAFAGGPSGFAEAPLLRYEANGSALALLDRGRIALAGTVTLPPPVPVRRPVVSVFSPGLEPRGSRVVPLSGIHQAVVYGLEADRRAAPVVAARVTDGEREGTGLYRFVGRRFRLDRSFGHAGRAPTVFPATFLPRAFEAGPDGGLISLGGNSRAGSVVLQRFNSRYERARPRVRVRQGRCVHGRRRIRVRVRDASPVERVTVRLNGRRLRSGARRSMLLRIRPRAGGRRLRVTAEDAARNVRVAVRRVRFCSE